MDPKEPPEGIPDADMADIAMYMLQNNIGELIVEFDANGDLSRYEERPLNEDEDE